MDFDFQWLLIGLPVAFALGWLASRFDIAQLRRADRDAPRAYFKGLNLLLNEQHDKAIDAFIEAVQHDPDTAELHFALGSLFRRRGEFERAVRVHEHLLARADLAPGDRDRAQHELAQDYTKAGLLDRAEAAYRALDATPFANDAQLSLLLLHERSRDWRKAIAVAQALEGAGRGSFAQRVAHHHCELALEADAAGRTDEADAELRRALLAAPQAARPLVLAGERHAAAGRAAAAFDAWDQLRQRNPPAFVLIADAYARAAQDAGRADAARAALQALYAQAPGLELRRALAVLDAAPPLEPLLASHPTLAAAEAWLDEHAGDTGLAAVRAAVARAAAPLRRYRCAACGFEARRYFWQCPGCLSWDSYPPQPIDAL